MKQLECSQVKGVNTLCKYFFTNIQKQTNQDEYL